MSGERDKASENPYQHLRLEGTRDALVVYILSSKIVAEEDVQQFGGELLAAADVAARIDMPLVLSFQGVQFISSALVGKLVLLNKKLRSAGITWSMIDVSPGVAEVIRQVFPGDGPAGSMAVT